MGLGPPGAPYLGAPNYRARLSNPLLLEGIDRLPDVAAVRDARRVADADEMIAMLYTYSHSQP